MNEQVKAKKKPRIKCTQLSLAEMRKRGYTVALVERWNAHAGITQDLFGFIDILCLGNGEVVGVQSTSDSNMAARVTKITEHENVAAVRKAGIRILVHGWKKAKIGAGHTLREVDIS